MNSFYERQPALEVLKGRANGKSLTSLRTQLRKTVVGRSPMVSGPPLSVGFGPRPHPRRPKSRASLPLPWCGCLQVGKSALQDQPRRKSTQADTLGNIADRPCPVAISEAPEPVRQLRMAGHPKCTTQKTTDCILPNRVGLIYRAMPDMMREEARFVREVGPSPPRPNWRVLWRQQHGNGVKRGGGIRPSGQRGTSRL
jgi:hypothetical protein